MKTIHILFLLILFYGCGKQHTKEQEAAGTNMFQFEWDFHKERIVQYSFKQTSDYETKFGPSREAIKSTLSAVGYLDIEVGDDQMADIDLHDLVSTMVQFSDTGSSGDTLRQLLPAMAIQDMRSDGSFTSKSADMLFGLLFPVPEEPVHLGEKWEKPLEMPFNVGASQMVVKGQVTLTYIGHQEIFGHNCAVMKGEIDISKLDLPKKVSKKNTASVKGEATYYLDTDEGVFVGIDLTLMIETGMNQSMEGDFEFEIDGFIKNKSVYTLRLIED